MVLFTQGVALHYPSHSAASVLSVKVKVVRALHYANIDVVASMDYHGQFNGLQPEYRAFLLYMENTKITINAKLHNRFGRCQDKKNLDQRTSE